MASLFVGAHGKLGVVQEFAGTISGEVDGTPYAGDFKEEPHCLRWIELSRLAGRQ